MELEGIERVSVGLVAPLVLGSFLMLGRVALPSVLGAILQSAPVRF